MVTRTQAFVLGFFLVVWVSLLVILVAAPDVYDQALSLPGGRGTELAFLAALSGLIGLLVVFLPGSGPFRLAVAAGVALVMADGVFADFFVSPFAATGTLHCRVYASGRVLLMFSSSTLPSRHSPAWRISSVVAWLRALRTRYSIE